MLNNVKDWCDVLACPVCLNDLQPASDKHGFHCSECCLSLHYDQNIPIIVENTQLLSGIKESCELDAQVMEHRNEQLRQKTSNAVKSRASTLLEKHAIKTLPHHNILEIGSGPFESLHDVTGNVKVSIDPLATSYRDKIFTQREQSNIIQGFAEILPFRDNFFDVIMTRNSFDHLNNPDLAVLEFNRVLKSDGICIIECYVDSDPFVVHEPFVLTERFITNHISRYFHIISSKRVPRPEGFSWDWIELELKPKKIHLEHRPYSANIFNEISESYIELYAKGCNALEQGDFAGAIVFLKLSAEKHPIFFWNTLMLTEAYLKSGRNEAAAYILRFMQERLLSGYFPYVHDPETHLQRLLQALPPERSTVTPDVKSARKKRILLIVCLYENNFGDILIYQTISSKLEASGYEVDTYEISQPLFASDFFAKSDECDFIYFVGGGIIERSAPDIIRYFNQVYWRLKAPYGIIGLSTGSFDYTPFAHSLKLLCDNAAFFFTRDPDSVETFRKYGATRVPVASADVVFANPRIPLLRTGERHRLTANFRNIPYPDITGEMDWQAWSAALKRIGVNTLLDDCSDAQGKLGIPISTNDIIHEIAGSRFIVAMRFHVILVAALLGIPSIPITYCPKVRRLAQQLGLSDFCLDIHDHDRLDDTVQSLLSRYHTTVQTLESKVSSLVKSAESSITSSLQTIKEIIHG